MELIEKKPADVSDYVKMEVCGISQGCSFNCNCNCASVHTSPSNGGGGGFWT